MGIFCRVDPDFFRRNKLLRSSKPCLDAEKEERPRARPNLAHQEPVFSSLLDVSTVCSERETMPNVLVPVPPSTWLPSWSIWLLKSLSWPAMLLVTTKDSYHSKTSSIGHQERRRIEQVTLWCDNCPRRSTAQHSSRPSAQKVGSCCQEER